MTSLLACLFSAAFGQRSISTGKERDSESGFANGNDYFGARYYASTMGRFLSPDWSVKVEPVPYSKLDNPQTLNLYNYMRNNPLAGVDPDGHCCEEDGEEENRENEEFEKDLGEVRETLNRREAAAADQREQQAFESFKKDNSGGYDDANGVSHIGPPTREEFERTQAANREKLEKGDVAGALGKGSEKPPTEDQVGKGVQGGKKDRSQQGTVDQLKDITKNQQNLRKIGKGEAIREIKKSQQDVDNANKRIKSSQDIEE